MMKRYEIQILLRAYYQLSISRKGKDTSRFVRRDEVATVKRQLRNFARLRTLVDEWIELGMELSPCGSKRRETARENRSRRLRELAYSAVR